MKIFCNNTSVCFIGDSNVSNGYFIDYMRSCFMEKNHRVFLYNMGVAGNSVWHVEALLEEELEYIRPDYAFIMFGVNDLGIWLYDGKKNLDDALFRARNNRIERYLKGLETVADALVKRGIIPVITSPICVNENIAERGNIETVTDNKEKEDYIGSDFYTKQTFKNINFGLKTLGERAKAFARSRKYKFFDLFNATARLPGAEIFGEDGIHLTKSGHRALASSLLNMSGCSDYYVNEINPKALAVGSEERDERAYYFIKYRVMCDYVGKLSNAELIERVKNFVNEKGFIEGVTPDRLRGFYKYASDIRSSKLALFEKIALLKT